MYFIDVNSIGSRFLFHFSDDPFHHHRRGVFDALPSPFGSTSFRKPFHRFFLGDFASSKRVLAYPVSICAHLSGILIGSMGLAVYDLRFAWFAVSSFLFVGTWRRQNAYIKQEIMLLGYSGCRPWTVSAHAGDSITDESARHQKWYALKTSFEGSARLVRLIWPRL